MSGFRDPRIKHFALGRLKSGDMNKTETAYNSHLETLLRLGVILWFKFEGIKLRLADRTFLDIDFSVMAADGVLEMHDVKASLNFIQEDAKVKMKVANETYPFRFFYVVQKKKKDGGGWDVVAV